MCQCCSPKANKEQEFYKRILQWNRDPNTIWLISSWFSIDSSERLFPLQTSLSPKNYSKCFMIMEVVYSRPGRSSASWCHSWRPGFALGLPPSIVGFLGQMTWTVLASISSSVEIRIIISVLLISFTGLLRESNGPTSVLKKPYFQVNL